MTDLHPAAFPPDRLRPQMNILKLRELMSNNPQALTYSLPVNWRDTSVYAKNNEFHLVQYGRRIARLLMDGRLLFCFNYFDDTTVQHFTGSVTNRWNELFFNRPTTFYTSQRKNAVGERVRSFYRFEGRKRIGLGSAVGEALVLCDADGRPQFTQSPFYNRPKLSKDSARSRAFNKHLRKLFTVSIAAVKVGAYDGLLDHGGHSFQREIFNRLKELFTADDPVKANSLVGDWVLAKGHEIAEDSYVNNTLLSNDAYALALLAFRVSSFGYYSNKIPREQLIKDLNNFQRKIQLEYLRKNCVTLKDTQQTKGVSSGADNNPGQFQQAAGF